MSLFPDHRVSKFLCCFTIRTGVLVFGWLGTIFNILALVGCISTLFISKDRFDQFHNATTDADQVALAERQADLLLQYQIYLSVITVACVFGLTMSILLLVGVYKNNVRFVRLFHLFLRISFIVTVFGLLRHLVLAMFVANEYVMIYLVVYCIMALMCLGPMYYEIVVVNSHLAQMAEGPKFQQFA